MNLIQTQNIKQLKNYYLPRCETDVSKQETQAKQIYKIIEYKISFVYLLQFNKNQF